jgi:hypothetical protein
VPILDIQRRQVEVGRIRIGQLVDGENRRGEKIKRPSKLGAFRFTTESRPLADQIKAHFGGEVIEWTPQGGGAKQWDITTPTKSLSVIVPPNSVSQWYEMWAGGACVRRCDGAREVLEDQPCQCPVDPGQRTAQAANGNACKPTTRINVMLADVPGIGVWRLETHGFYAATELPAVAELLAASGGYIPGRLELQERSARRPKARGDGLETRRWMVPVLHVDAAPAALLSGNGPQIGAGRDKVPPTAPGLGVPDARRELPAASPNRAAPAAPEPADGQRPTPTHGAEHYQEIGRTATAVGPVKQAVWDARRAGVLTPELEAYLARRAHEISNGLSDADTTAAPNGVVAEGDADEPDIERAWAALMDLAGQRGWKSSTLEQLVCDRFGKPSDECNGWQFVELAEAIERGEVTA